MRFGGSLALALLIAAGGAARAAAHEPPPDRVLSPGSEQLQFEPPAAGSYALPALGAAADGDVLDEEGRATRLHQLYDGKVVVLSFIYGACHDAQGCPLSLAVLDQVKRRCEDDPQLAGASRLITMSFDPARDTPQVMQQFRAGFRPDQADWRFLTTASSRELTPILEDYDQAIQEEYDEHGKLTGQFSHVLRVLLIDSEKRIRNVYSSSFLHADVIVNDMRTLLLEDAAVAAGSTEERATRVDLLALAENPPLGLPAVPVPSDNPLTRPKIDLGRKLFFDRRLSLNGTFSCAMCHVPEQGFTNHELATAVGIEGRTVRRNSPTIYNVAYAQLLFHDGRENRLEQQIWGPLLAANEMGNPSVGTLMQRIEALGDYDGLFEKAFEGRGLGMETLGMALASYQRTLVSGNSPFDRWHFGGEKGALSEAAARGFRLFSGRARCSACHRVGQDEALFTDHQMHNTGIGFLRAMGSGTGEVQVQVAPGIYVKLDDEFLGPISETPPSDLGLYEITQHPRDRWKYKTPSLRNVALTPPYMHDGSLGTLQQVVEFYNAGGIPNETLDPLISPLDLTAQEVSDLVAFLQSLTGDNTAPLIRDAQATPIGDPQ